MSHLTPSDVTESSTVELTDSEPSYCCVRLLLSVEIIVQPSEKEQVTQYFLNKDLYQPEAAECAAGGEFTFLSKKRV